MPTPVRRTRNLHRTSPPPYQLAKASTPPGGRRGFHAGFTSGVPPGFGGAALRTERMTKGRHRQFWKSVSDVIICQHPRRFRTRRETSFMGLFRDSGGRDKEHAIFVATAFGEMFVSENLRCASYRISGSNRKPITKTHDSSGYLPKPRRPRN